VRPSINDPRTAKLCETLLCSKLVAIGIAESLAQLCMEQYPDGKVRGTAKELGRALSWSGNPDEIIDALMVAGYTNQFKGCLCQVVDFQQRHAITGPLRLQQLAEQIYEDYPKKTARAKSLVKLVKHIRLLAKRFDGDVEAAAAWLHERVNLLRDSDLARRDGGRFVPYAPKWLDDGSYDSDPAVWQDKQVRKPSGFDPQEIVND
jgi:hypothetical protein